MTRQQAGRRNGPQSHGPVTPAGKAKSSRNATRHGLSGRKMFVLQNEHPQAWAELVADCVQTWRPSTHMEHRAVEEIAGAKWRLRRLRFIETGLFDLEMDQQSTSFADTYDDADESIRQALAFKSLADNSRSLALLSRYETRLQRAYQQAVEALKQLRSETAHPQNSGTSKFPNEPDEPVPNTAEASPFHRRSPEILAIQTVRAKADDGQTLAENTPEISTTGVASNPPSHEDTKSVNLDRSEG